MSRHAMKRVRRDVQMPAMRKSLPDHEEGYPIYYVTGDGHPLCAACLNANLTSVDADNREHAADPRIRGTWLVVGYQPNWEDADLRCGHCGKPIPAAYADASADR